MSPRSSARPIWSTSTSSSLFRSRWEKAAPYSPEGVSCRSSIIALSRAAKSQSPMQSKGTLKEEDGGYVTLTFHRVYRHKPEHVWDAISTPDGLREWLLCTHAVLEPRVGGRIELVS